MKNPVLIFGAGSVGKAAAEIFNQNEVLIYGFLDDKTDLHNKEIGTVTIMGNTDDDGFLKFIGGKTEAFVAIKNREDRKRIVSMLNERRKVMPVNAIHRNSVVSEDSSIGHGNLLNAGVIIGPFCSIGSHNIVQMGVKVEPNTKIGDFVEIGTGANISSRVTIEEGVFIGAGVTIVAGITIGKNARIGAGSIVIEDVAENTTVFGNPAKKI
jgi:sugar O-acyltransferase (sialic acid O-acetyltransferase NeuD family)